MQPATTHRLSGHVALDFVNTVDNWWHPAERDDLATFEHLAAWGIQVGYLQSDEADRLSDLPASETDAALAEARALRALLHRLFGAIIDEQPIAPSDLKAVNSILSAARAHQTLRAGPGAEGFAWAWAAPLGPRIPALRVALEAADLLERGAPSRVKRCPAPEGCGWLFLDESRNRSRRWCSMKFCGGHAKARRFAAAHRDER